MYSPERPSDGDRVVLGCGAELIPCLVELPWYEVSLGGRATGSG